MISSTARLLKGANESHPWNQSGDSEDFFAFAFSPGGSQVRRTLCIYPCFERLIKKSKSSQVLLLTTWLLVQCVGTPLVAGKTSYELYGSLNYQTLVNKVKKAFRKHYCNPL